MNRKTRRATNKKLRKDARSAPIQHRTGPTPAAGRIASLFAEALRHQQSGRHAEAVAFYDRIIDSEPDLAAVHCNRGVALATLTRLVDAEAAYVRAIALKPDQPETHNNLGDVYRRLGRYDDAVQALMRAVALNPRYAEAFGNLGNTFKDQGRFHDAELAYRTAATLTPHAPQAHNNLGAVLCELDKLDEAEQTLRQALLLAPDFLEAHLNLATVLELQGRFGEAEAACRRVIAIDPGRAEAYCKLGNALVKLNRLQEAVVAYRRAIELNPNLAETHHNLGVALKVLGRLGEARSAVERATQLAPRKAAYFHSLSALKDFAAGDPHLAAMENLLGGIAALNAEQQIGLHFALAKAYEDLGRYDDSFHQLLAGNALKRRNVAYDEASTLAEIERTSEVFSPDLLRRLQGCGEPSTAPVFIIGMPRSGSTLIEQILASHPQIYGGGELPQFSDGVMEIAKNHAASFPDVFALLSGAELRQLGSRYVAGIAALAPGASRIVNKTLSNFLYAGLIHLALPHARIIHAVRDPVATCLSCFTKLFSSGQLYSYDLAELGRLYRHYQALMDHWHRVLPQGGILDVRYEDVVADLEGQARRMLAYCGLGWDERCLDFHKTERPVHTASTVQVRQPLYRDALDRWRSYRSHLAPLFAELSGERSDAPARPRAA
ncbi:MAG TPA: tetratricopeptide repeat protein [Xanthobacteraceae bacterium]|nr:tetratricopeptide repeat protein [Xanthobacteraceae bacterium]